MDDMPFCPATMCPLFAAAGSTWSGEVDARCSGADCGWYGEGVCRGGRVATMEVAAASSGGHPWPRLGKVRQRRLFDCPRARDCAWQTQSPGGLCAPRRALMHGLDPRGCE